MAFDTVESEGLKGKEEVETPAVQLSQWVISALLRGEEPERLAEFVASEVPLEDHDFEELQAELRERSKEKKASQETEKPELGKPPPLPKEAPLQQLRRNLAELDAIMARLAPEPVRPVAVVQGPALRPQLVTRSVMLPMAYRPEPRASVPLVACGDRQMLPSEDRVGRQINDFIKARFGPKPHQSGSLKTPPVAQPSAVRSVSPTRVVTVRYAGHSTGPIMEGSQAPSQARRARSSEPRGPVVHQRICYPVPVRGPSRALSATALSRANPPQILVTGRAH